MTDLKVVIETLNEIKSWISEGNRQSVEALWKYNVEMLKARAAQFDNCTLEERVYVAIEQPELAPYLKKD